MKTEKNFKEVNHNETTLPYEAKTNINIVINDYWQEEYTDGSFKSFLKANFQVGEPPNILQHSVVIPMSELNSQKFLRYIPDDIIFKGTSVQKQRYFVNLLNDQLINKIPEKRYVLHQGFNKISDRIMYAMGNTVINADSPNYISHSQYKVKPHPKNKDWIKWLIRFSKMGDIFPVLLIAALVPYIKPLLNEAKIYGASDFSVYLYGKTSSGKTEIVKLLTGLFEGNENMISLSSDKKAINKLSEFKDTCVLIDDLHMTTSRRVRDSNEAKIASFLHQKSSSGMITNNDKNARIDSMIFITAEYPPTNHSTINRCLIAEMPEIDMNALTYLQENQNLYVKFVIEFIEWICKNFAELANCINTYKNIYNTEINIDESAYSGVNRILRTELILNTTKMLFKKFLTKDLYITENETTSIDRIFKDSIKSCINETLNLVKREDDSSKRAYVDVLLRILSGQDNEFYVAKSFKEYKKFKRNHNDFQHKEFTPHKIFFKEDEYYCINGDDLKKLYENLESFEHKPTKKAISAQFRNYGLLEFQGGELSFPLKGRKGKQRFYHLKLLVIAGMFSDTQKAGIRCSELANDFANYIGSEEYYGSWNIE